VASKTARFALTNIVLEGGGSRMLEVALANVRNIRGIARVR
jgi:hypothetical protein